MEIRVGSQLLDVTDRVHVPLDKVAAKPLIGPQRPLEIDGAAGLERPERGDANRFGADIGVNLTAFGQNHGQADAVDRQAVTRFQLGRQRGADAQTAPAAGRLALAP